MTGEIHGDLVPEAWLRRHLGVKPRGQMPGETVSEAVAQMVRDYNYAFENLRKGIGLGLGTEWSRERVAMALLELVSQNKVAMLELEREKAEAAEG